MYYISTFKKENKYKNKKYKAGDIEFDSQKEASRYFELKLLERGGIISNLDRQVPFVLIEKSKYGREVKYVADFVYIDNEKGIKVVEDVKSSFTAQLPLYRLKKRLLAEKYDIVIREV